MEAPRAAGGQGPNTRTSRAPRRPLMTRPELVHRRGHHARRHFAVWIPRRVALPAAALAQMQDPVGAAVRLANGVLDNSPSGGSSSAVVALADGRAHAGNNRSRPTPAPAPRNTADGYMNLRSDLPGDQAPAPRRFDWTSDGLQLRRDQRALPRRLQPACDRHDFGYRNYRGALGLALDHQGASHARRRPPARRPQRRVPQPTLGITETPCLPAAARGDHAAARAQSRRGFMAGQGGPPSVPTPAVPGFNTGASRARSRASRCRRRRQQRRPPAPHPGRRRRNNPTDPRAGRGRLNPRTQVLTRPRRCSTAGADRGAYGSTRTGASKLSSGVVVAPGDRLAHRRREGCCSC